MEKGLARLMEAAQVAADQEQDHMIYLEILPEGVRARIVWEGDNLNKYSHENVTSWRALHPRPDTKNPLITAMDELVRHKTEFTL